MGHLLHLFLGSRTEVKIYIRTALPADRGSDPAPLLSVGDVNVEFCVQFCAAQYEKEMWSSRSRSSREQQSMIEGLEHLSSEKRLKELGLHSPEKKQLRGDLISVYKYLKGAWQGDGATVVPSNSTRGNGQKLMLRRFHPVRNVGVICVNSDLLHGISIKITFKKQKEER